MRQWKGRGVQLALPPVSWLHAVRMCAVKPLKTVLRLLFVSGMYECVIEATTL